MRNTIKKIWKIIELLFQNSDNIKFQITRYMFANKCVKYCFLATFSFFIYFFMKSPLHGACPNNSSLCISRQKEINIRGILC